MGKDTYSADQIQILEGLEPVRRRPGMYIGSTDLRGLHHLVVELVDNSIDEALAGWCDTIKIVLHADRSVSVLDNGRGIPVGMHPTARKSALEVVLTTLHAGGKFGGGGYKVSGGLHGVGLSVVNALSERLVVEVYRDGETHHQEYTRGVPDGPVTVVGKSDQRGTYVRFWPDPEIFPEIEFSWDTVCTSLRSYAFLNKGITIQLADERDGRTYTFHFEGGIQSFVRYLNANRNVINQKPMYVEREIDGNVVEIALQYQNTVFTEHVLAFANNVHTEEGGAHVTGFRSALTATLNKYARKAAILKEQDPNLSGDDVRDGLTAVISVKLREPQFEGQTKTKLGNSEVAGQVSTVLSDALMQYLEENPADGRRIIDQSLTAARARQAAAKARDLVQRKSLLEFGDAAGKARRLQRARPGALRDLHRRGTVRRRHRQGGAGAPQPGNPAASRQDPQRREGAGRQDPRQRADQGPDHGARGRLRRDLQRRQAPLSPHRAHGGRRRRRLAYPHACCSRSSGATCVRSSTVGFLYLAQPPLYKLEKGKGRTSRPSTPSATTSVTTRSSPWAATPRCLDTRDSAR